MKKTLVIHPTDPTTDFLKEVYKGKDWTVMVKNIDQWSLKSLMKEYDRIVMLGHGENFGMLGYGRLMIDHSFATILREKECVYIWCNADRFVDRFGLHGFNTGMIISEPKEAMIYNVKATNQEIEDSNYLFGTTVGKYIDENNRIKLIKKQYKSNINPIIKYNHPHIYDVKP